MVHVPVLLKEIIEYLDPKHGDKIVDATLGCGGHAMALVEKVAPDGKVLGIEWDKELLEEFKVRIKNHEFRDNFILVNDSYVNIENIVREHNFRPNGILFDLGLSSWHLGLSGRGFSFRKDEPLDMRYNTYRELKNKNDLLYRSSSDYEGREKVRTAAEVVNTYSEEELERIFREYGEEKFSKQIAGNIVHTRRREPILKTSDLVEMISRSVPAWYKKRKIHFATKTFQALRVEVNSELKNVEKGVSSAIDVLESGGRLAVISFQGLEGKIVREIFKRRSKEGAVRFVVKGTVRPSWEEIKSNPRARSAKMKVIEKL